MRVALAASAALALFIARAAGQPAAVVAGELHRMHSSALGEEREFYVATPAGYTAGTERYAVLFVLDGERLFRYAAATADLLADSDRIPKLLVVGIASGSVVQRTRDLTPPSASDTDNRFSPGNGGADRFLAFVGEELIPFIDKSYRTRPYRLLAGHSFGGLFALHTLARRTALFNGYIAIDPTASWNNGAVVGQMESLFTKAKNLPLDLYVTASNAGGTWPADIRRLARVCDGGVPAGFRSHFEWFPDETHASVPLRSIHAALDGIFSGWHLTDPLALYDKSGIEAVHRHFREGGKRFRSDRNTPPFTVSLIVAGLIRSGRLDEAGAVLLHDEKTYPAPWNQLDALARAYAAAGNRDRAARYYQLSLNANPHNEWAKQKLAEMGAKR